MVAALSARVERHFRGLYGQVVDLLYPPRCVACQRMGAWLCEACQDSMPRVVPPICVRCGDAVAVDGLCGRCRSSPPRIGATRSVFYFDGVAREVIHCFKYDGLTALASLLAGSMVTYWHAHALPADVVVPVPLHAKRQGERGYNQSALLARELARLTGLPLDERTTVRRRATAPQVDLDAQQRKENVRGAFVAVGTALAGRDVLLIDDVCTTGATLEACATALLGSGVHRVHALTLARAR